MPVNIPQPVLPAGNFMASLKQFVGRGGTVNGLNPAIVGRIWYVNANTESDRAERRGTPGSDSNNGLSPFTPFLTMDRAFEFIDTYDVIVLNGVIREQLVAPLDVYDITIIGGSNLPRQATTATGGVPADGTPTGGGSCWLPPHTGAIASTPLLEIQAAGWAIQNIEFSPVNGSAGVRLSRSAVTDTLDASHANFSGCFFGGNGGTTQIGIEDNGGCGFVQISNCRFQNLTSAVKGLNTGAAIPLSWMIQDSRFQQNTNDITMSLSYAIIQRNKFMTAGSGATNKVISTTFVSVQGGNNHVLLNQFSNTEVEIAPGSGYTGAATDTWMNYVNNQAALAFGQPA